MYKVIRKISIGSGVKEDAMHYELGQRVYGGHEICDIVFDPKHLSYKFYIEKNKKVLPWQKFHPNLGISI